MNLLSSLIWFDIDYAINIVFGMFVYYSQANPVRVQREEQEDH
jgi:hypothetical protein